jgi:stress response protein YsnF
MHPVKHQLLFNPERHGLFKNFKTMATDNNRNRRLQELSGSDYEIADGDSDIRGWDVKDASGRRIGEVDELIFDVESRKVRYMVVDLDDDELDLDDDRDVLIPIGLAQLDEDDDDVILNNVTADQLRALPEYDDDDAIDTTYESNIRRVFGGVGGAALTGAALTSDSDTVRDRDTDFYNHEHFNDANLRRNRRQDASRDTDITNDRTDETIPVIRENLQVGKEEVERGGIRLRSRVTENPVEETVNLREENVNVERNPVDRAATEADFREEDVEMRERAEVPVVNKEARVVEEINLNKEVTEREETIRDTVRETEVDIDKLDKNSRRSTDRDTDRV